MFDYLREYQIPISTECWMSKSPKVVLAASCGSGKTFMAIAYIIEWLKSEIGDVLVLTHGTRVLRDNFNSQVNDFFKIFPNEQQEQMFRRRVVVTLPQSFKKFSGNFSLVVVDEAHHFYFKGMVKAIIESINCKKELLLTGTPSNFNRDKINYNINYLPMFELPEENLSDVLIELATSSAFKLGHNDLNNKGDLIEDKSDLVSNATEEILNDVLKCIYKKIKSATRTYPVPYSWAKVPCNWTGVLTTLKKTIFACQSIPMAERVKVFFDGLGISCLISTSEDDKESISFIKFKEDPSFKVLIIVRRGALGFNMSELGTIVDLTMSANIDRLHQLFNRLVRPGDVKKFYFKITCPELAQWMVHIMTASVLLGHRKWMSEWNGVNFKDMVVPVLKKNNVKKASKNKGTSSKKNGIKVRYFMEIPSLKCFKDLIHKDGSLLSSYKYVKLGEIRKELFGINFYDTEETKRKLLELAMSGAPRPKAP